MLNPTISTANNRFDSGQGYSYDSSGNTAADAEGRTFVYDAENKQVEVIESSVTIGAYFYEGDGKRVKKIAGSEETIFVYDAGGKLIGEYSTVVQTGSNAKTVYTTNDHLGSPRINTDGVGTVISRHDYHPFGEEIARTGYGSDTISKQFTGYERDGETGLDYARARMYGNNLGRFTSVDPLASRIAAPQSHNKYLYVENNPLKFTDPTGESLVINGDYANDLVSELEKSTGYILTRCSEVDKAKGCGQVGQILIDKSAERSRSGTSTKLADALKSVIENLKDNKGGDVTVTMNTARNDSGNFIDRFSSRTVDVGDLQAIRGAGSPGPSFVAGQLGHILGEYSAAAVNRANGLFAGLDSSGNPVTHSAGLALETEIMSELDGDSYSTRRGGFLPDPYKRENTAVYIYEGTKGISSYSFTFKPQVNQNTLRLEHNLNVTSPGHKYTPKTTQVPQ
jgi:RHS repeat-associated protein